MGGYVSEKIRRQTRALVITGQARERLRKLQAANPAAYNETLMDSIPRITPEYVRPLPLKPYVDLIERTVTERVFAVVAAPPQHSKTETTMHGLAWLVRSMPGKKHAYVTYSQTRAREVSNMCRWVFERAGIRITGTMDHWYLPDFSSEIKWTSAGGGLTGYSLTGVMFVDDPFKSRQDACSPVYQARVLDWYDDVATKRMNPGSSMIVFMARWDQNDLSGSLLKRITPLGEPYTHVNLKGIYEGDGPDGDDREIGEPLWEDRKPLSELEREREINPYSFASLYQGSPVPRGGALFRSPVYYDELPSTGYRVGLGTDLAYSKKTYADFSVLAEIWRVDGQRVDGLPVFYVVKVERAQVEAPAFVLTLRNAANHNPATSIYWYAAGVETGAASFIQERGVPLVVIPPTGDKYSRAQGLSEAWNDGRVMIPSEKFIEENHGDHRWVDPCAYEVTGFTGVNDPQDDQVDALVSAYDALQFEETDYNVTGGKSSRR